MRLAGKDILQTTKHIIIPPSKHEVVILEGDAKNSHIVETYERVADGTKITIDGDFKLYGKLKMSKFLLKGNIERSICDIIDDIGLIIERS